MTVVTCGDKTSLELADQLVSHLAQLVPCVVAFSGGVDSAVVAAAVARAEGGKSLAARAAATMRPGAASCGGAERSVAPLPPVAPLHPVAPLPGRSVAVTALSAAVPQAQREIASRVAAEIGIEHVFVESEELSRADYASNDASRCFYCKQTLYQTLRPVVAQRRCVAMVSGTNADDLGDYRPGIEAGRMAGVSTPLADLGIGKAAVRDIAAAWGLSVAQLPAAPCLASRIAYGVSVTAERLRKIELAEQWLGQQGFSPLRVRLHEGEMARIEVAAESLPRLVSPPLIDQVRRRLSDIGFRGVTVDLAGFRSGSMNQLFNLSLPQTRSS